MKRLLDVVVGGTALVMCFPVIALAAMAVWLNDRAHPIYVGTRARDRETTFRIYKLRTMVRGADRIGGPSTPQNDSRVTRVGRLLRRFKIDELPQLVNVLRGDMSLVGPRPQVREGVDRYTPTEWALLDVRPGITDFASIVFADEGAILAREPDPDTAYDSLIRPGKSRLGLFYVSHRTFFMDVGLLVVTAVGLVSRPHGLRGAQAVLRHYAAPADLVRLAGRRDHLRASEAPDRGLVLPRPNQP